MAWGQRRGIDDLLARLESNDAQLTSLYLMRTRQFGPSEATQLCRVLADTNTTLQELDISSHTVTPDMAAAFAQLLAATKTLNSISLGNSTFGDEALAALCSGLATNQSLQRLDLEAKGITHAGCAALASALAANTTLQEVILSRNDIGAQGLAHITPAVGQLQSLHLSSCGLTCDKSTDNLADVLKGTTGLHTLRYEDNELHLNSAETLAASLKACVSLQSLYLRGTPLPAAHITPNLPPSLQHLDLSNTQIHSDGVVHLAQAAAKGSLGGLRTLILCDVGADGAAIAQLARGLATHTHALTLDIGGNTVDADALQALSSCSCIESLRLHDCKLGDAGVAALQSHAANGGFVNLADLDISANYIGKGLEGLLTMLRDNLDVLSKLKILVIAVNPGLDDDSLVDIVTSVGECRPELRLVRRNADSGEQQPQER